MSGTRYKRKQNEDDDEVPLPMNMEEESDAVEMHTVGDSIAPYHDEDAEVSPQDEGLHEENVRVVYKRRKFESCYLVWAIIATVLFLGMVVVAIFAHQQSRKTKWCCIGDAEMEKCGQMAKAFAADGFVPGLECVSATSPQDCVHKIDTDVADLFSISNENLYRNRDILKPIMAEDYEESHFGYYLVAVVRQVDNTTKLTREGLSHKHACVKDLELTGGYLRNKSIITTTSGVCDTKASVAKLFLSVCSPATTLFQDCPERKQATNESQVIDNIESCLFQKHTQITFIDHISALNFMKNKPGFEEDYQLLCEDGTHSDIKDFKSCHLLQEPSHSLVVSSKIRSGVDVDVPMELVEVLLVAQLYFGLHTTTKFNMFKPGDGRHLLFQDETKKLVPLQFNCTAPVN
ncbi:unnamed protein product [Clavelina lepadiformis]|uniref:Transferrin-like domain-containing protein n=1 Tax=Clavelina lepadiformis TaxID=159417 RepID=A0ABP0EZ97_CLALP